jgi:hypothetical protein
MDKKTVAKIATEIEPYLSQDNRFYPFGRLTNIWELDGYGIDDDD